MNKGLLLLAKLENDAFPDKQWLSLDNVLRRNLDLMDDVFQHQSMQVVQFIQNKQVFASSSLMEILISNLLSNVLAHSSSEAKVIITLNDQYLEISNDGEPLTFEPSRLFIRFGKGAPGYNGNGLGLSIVKQTCIACQWDITYSYHRGMHHFKISFDNLKTQIE